MAEMKDYGRPIDIPVIGEGSQAGMEGDDNFNFTESPGAMHTFDRPLLPEPEEVENLTVAKDMLVKLYAGIKGYTCGEPAIKFDVAEMDAANVDLINQIFNEGEVSVIYESDASVQIQESVLTGIWRVRINNETGTPISDVIEIADIPSIVRDKTFQDLSPIDTSLENIPENAFNAPPILTELAEKMDTWKVGDLHHVINLTLLPLSEQDMALLGSRLGVGPITILSRGYGNCRIGSTTKKNIWWVKFFNSDDKLILNTIEVIDIPEVATAAPEDIEDSAERLKDILEVYDVHVD
jgi:hydrogenase-1 operon protein HyaF